MNSDLRALRRTVWSYWKKHGRHDLPWRRTIDPYKILVSEMMLQQTQVSRVIPKYESFIAKFPTAHSLAKAPLSDVLREWSGLGYNRRAKYLHDAAKHIVATAPTGCTNNNAAACLLVQGIGPYTRSAVLVFAFNEPLVLLETNIRTVFIHHFLGDAKKMVSDKELEPLITAAAQNQDPRTWHWALMDYGAHLKESGVRLNSRSAHYTKQSKFEGSLRQVRGAVLRELHKDAPNIAKIPFEKENIQRALESLTRDGLIKEFEGKWMVA